MSATPDSTLADSSRTIADLRRKLAECETERDAALARKAATTEVLAPAGGAGPVHSIPRNPGSGPLTSGQPTAVDRRLHLPSAYRDLA